MCLVEKVPIVKTRKHSVTVQKRKERIKIAYFSIFFYVNQTVGRGNIRGLQTGTPPHSFFERRQTGGSKQAFHTPFLCEGDSKYLRLHQSLAFQTLASSAFWHKLIDINVFAGKGKYGDVGLVRVERAIRRHVVPGHPDGLHRRVI